MRMLDNPIAAGSLHRTLWSNSPGCGGGGGGSQVLNGDTNCQIELHAYGAEAVNTKSWALSPPFWPIKQGAFNFN